jgi:hypothetical protein
LIELSQYVKIFDPEVSQKVSIMLRYLNKSKKKNFHRSPRLHAGASKAQTPFEESREPKLRYKLPNGRFNI